MLQNLTYKKKYYLLLAFTALFAVLAYKWAFSKTITLYVQNRQLENRVKEADNAPARFSALRSKLSAINHVIETRQTDSVQGVHDFLLATLSRYCKENNTVLKSFPETSVYRQGDFEIETNSFTVQGDFISLLKLVYLLEQKERTGKVSSVVFQSGKDNDLQRTVLTATVYLQTVKNIE